MIDAQLHRRVLLAYEIGRLQMAARILWLLLPLAALCLTISYRPQVCLIVGVALSLAALALRWRDRAGVEQVKLGLIAGVFPLTMALLVGRFETIAGRPLGCTAICVASALAAGMWLGMRVAERRQRINALLSVVAIACATASLGCLNLGIS